MRRRARTARASGPSTSRAAPSGRSRPATGRVDAPSWGPGGHARLSRHGAGREPLRGRRHAADRRARTSSRSAASWASPTEFYYVSDGKIRKRAIGGARADGALHRHDAGDAAAVHAAARATSIPRRRARRWASSARSSRRTAPKVAFAALGDIYVDGHRRQAGEPDERSVPRHRSRPGRPMAASWRTRPTAAAICFRSGFAT